MSKYNKRISIFLIIIFLFLADINAQQAELISNHEKSKIYVELKDQSLNWNEGFAESIAGEEIDYYSENPKANHALITRASDGKISIKWKTASAEKISKNGFVTFVWLAGTNCNTNEQPFDLEINGKKILTFSTRFAEEWKVSGLDNTNLKFSALKQDAHGDLFGYMILTIPVGKLDENKCASLNITGQAKNTNNWVMVFTYPNAVRDFQNAAQNGFWYKLSLRENEEKIKFEFPSSWSGNKIKLQSQAILIAEEILSSDNNCSLTINNTEILDNLIELFLNENKIDVLPPLTGSDISYSIQEDGSVINRTWKILETEKAIECSKNDFIEIPENRLSWPKYVQDFPAITKGDNNTIWMAVTERLAFESYISVYKSRDGKQEKICMLQSENQTGIAAPAIAKYKAEVLLSSQLRKIRNGLLHIHL